MFKGFKLKSEFTRNVLTLMTGSMIAQAIPIAISPILTRIYTPEEFGTFAIYMSVLGIFSIFATGRYELAIMLPKKNEDAFKIVVLSIFITFFISILSFIIIFIFNSQLVSLLNNSSISKWLYLIPISVLFTGLYQSFNYWNNRNRNYKKIALSRVSRSVITGSSNIGFGLANFNTLGLIIGNLLGQIVSTIILGKELMKKYKKFSVFASRIKFLALMKKYKKFPMINLPNAFIDSFRLSGINLLIAKYFATNTLGQFSLAWRMVQVPIVLIGGSLGQVFFQKVASSNREDLYKIILKYITKASLIATPIFLIIYLYAKEIFLFVFGENWGLAGESASIMAPWLFINFVSSPLVSVMLILNKQELILLFSIFYAIIPLGLIIAFNDLSFLYILKIITFAMSVLLILFSLVIIKQAKNEREK